MADWQELCQDAKTLANCAVESDTKGQVNEAIFYYTEAAEALNNAHMCGAAADILSRANQYLDRAEQLKQAEGQQDVGGAAQLKTDSQQDLDRVKFLLSQALDEDEQGHADEAIELYIQAAQLCIESKNTHPDLVLQAELSKHAKLALERGELLKRSQGGLSAPPAAEGRRSPASGLAKLDIAQKPRAVSKGGKYSAEEIEVLRRTSDINGRVYVPFLSIDFHERFAFSIPFTDKDGKLKLAPQQHSNFQQWARPDEICTDPRMYFAVSAFSIRQTVVQDCSFVSSLAIGAQYERRFRKRLITGIIFPQNKNGDPVYNPCGKYMIKFYINGVPRKVIIDDYLPVGRHGKLLCSFSNNTNELWVSLLEKAYMKVMGGYDFPGSNSNIDLYALTGWIPDRVTMHSDSFNKDKTFEMMKNHFHKGNVLITIATGHMSKDEADRAGLVPTHAYAMLNIVLTKDGRRLLQLKNPWNHQRWRGNYSELDTKHWTPQLQDELNFNVQNAQHIDNGVFWIDLDSLCTFFDVFYLSWNPEIFSHTYCLHQTWMSSDGPRKDVYMLGNNPQYLLDVKCVKRGPVWVLLSRHITDKDDFADNKVFITIVVYKTGGKQIFYPSDPPPYIDGVRINTPHYLCKMDIDPSNGQRQMFTLVVSQYEKTNTIHYTLRVFSSLEFSISKFPDPYKHEKSETGQWKGRTGGGCANNRETYKFNPIYQLKLEGSDRSNKVMVQMKGPKEYNIGFEVTAVSVEGSQASQKYNSGDFRRGFCYVQLDDLPCGLYNVIPATYYPNQEGPFIITVKSSCQMKLSKLQ